MIKHQFYHLDTQSLNEAFAQPSSDDSADMVIIFYQEKIVHQKKQVFHNAGL